MKKIIRMLATPFMVFITGAKRVPILRRIELLSIALYSVIIVVQAIKAFDPSAWWVLALPLLLPFLVVAATAVFYFMVVFVFTFTSILIALFRFLKSEMQGIRNEK